MKRLALASLLGIVLSLTGCATVTRVYFRPAGEVYEYGPPTLATRVRVPETGDRPLLVQAACLGLIEVEKKDRSGLLAEFEFRVKNRTGSEVVFPVSAFVLKDDEGHEIAAAALDDQPSDKAGAPVSVADGERGSFAFSFDVTRAIDPDRVGSMVLRWSVKIGGEEKAQETKFVRFELRDGGWPPPYHPFGARLYGYPYWVGGRAPLPPYYYDPFFDDPWFWGY